MKRFAAVVTVFGLCSGLIAQSSHDMRDVVETKKGKEIRGRVSRAYDANEVLILQGGKRIRVQRRQIERVTTVNDHLREFFKHRSNAHKTLDREWMLVEWALSKKLDRMARLQAMHVVVEYGDDQRAHEFLGHRRTEKEWVWPHESSWLTREHYDTVISDWGNAIVLEGEHFSVRTNAGLRHGLNALFDLERLYVWWMDTWGETLEPKEVLQTMEVHVHKSPADFPGWTSSRYPYYFPQPNGDVSYTFVREDVPSPDLLLQLGTEQIFYNALVDGMGTQATSPKNRFVAWLEIGFGQWVESSFVGQAGYMEPAKPALDRQQGITVLRTRQYGLENMIGLQYGSFHDVTEQTVLHWANTSTFVAFLMDDPDLREKLMNYIDLAYNKSKGNSSSLFDKVFGARIETLEKPWIEWLEKKVGVTAQRRSR